MTIIGRGGRNLRDEWRKGARAYLGVTVSGFPNFFMLYGPNTNLGHNSILVMIEAQVDYILDALRKMQARGLRRIDVKRPVMDDYNRQSAAGPREVRLGHDRARAGTSWPTARSPTTGRTARSATGGCCAKRNLEDYDT